MFEYFDAHSHVQMSEFDADREELLTAMTTDSIGTIAVGVDIASSKKAIALAKTHKNVFSAIGRHPSDTNEAFSATALEEIAREARVVAIGECGLDYFREDDIASARAKQVPIFEAQIALSAKTKKPLMIHARPSNRTIDAYREIIDILKNAKREYGDALTGNMHFFAGGIDEARDFFDMDFTVSYTAVITFTHDYDEVVRFAPIDRLLSETDSPYVAPAPNRGKRNDPRAVKAVVATLASIRGEKEDFVRDATVKNAIRVFHIQK